MQKIIIYTQRAAPQSQELQAYLKDHQISFHNIDVNGNKTAIEALMRKTGQVETPVLIAQNTETEEERIVIGFNAEAVDEAVGLQQTSQRW